MPEQKKNPKMFEPQEEDPEKMLPAGTNNAALRLFYILIINAIVFGLVYAIVYILFRQSGLVSRVAAEVVTILSLIASFVFWAKNKDRG